MATFNQNKWLAMVLKSFVNTDEDFLKTIFGFIDVKENDKITIPVFGVDIDDVQTDSGDTVFVSPDQTAIEIATKDEVFLGISFLRKTALSTNINLFTESAMEMGKVLKKKLALLVRNNMVDGVATANKYTYDTATGGTAVTAINHKMVLKAHEVLDLLEVPLEDRMLIIKPSMRSDLVNMEDNKGNLLFISNAQLGDEIVYKGQIGMVDGFRVMLKTLPKVDESGNIHATPGNNTRDCILFYHKSAWVYGAEKSIFTRDEFNTTSRQWQLFTSLFKGDGAIHDTHMVQIRQNDA